jgi:ribosomal protein L7/L12
MNHDLSPEQLSAIHSALQQGSKIEAVKLYRDATGASLADSKDAVEAMEGGQKDVLPSMRSSFVRPALTSAPPSVGMTPEKMNAIVTAISRGNKIEAIKLYREATGLGLAESKDAVEAMEISPPGSTPVNPGQLVPEGRTPLPQWDPFEEKKKGCLGVMALLIGTVILFVTLQP